MCDEFDWIDEWEHMLEEERTYFTQFIKDIIDIGQNLYINQYAN